MKTENLIYKMLKTNTGVHMCDSGGGNGRAWQRNATKKHSDFKKENEATLNTEYDYFDITISLYHHLVKTLTQDDFCKRFNKLSCDDWDGDFYGTSVKQCNWLERNDFIVDPYRAEFNSYNWDSNFSQIVQGTFLRQGGYVDNYVLLQIHGGADVRGGYTDAKLFKVDSDYFLYESVSFSIDDNMALDINGDDVSIHNYITHDDNYVDFDDFKKLTDKKDFIGSMTY